MKSRAEIKAIAKNAFKQQRSTSVLLLFVYGLISFALAALGYIPLWGALTRIGEIFLIVPLCINLTSCYIKIYKSEQTSLDEMFSNFEFNYLRRIGGVLWMGLFTFLWWLLLFIPGIIKSFSYMMTPYILADCPNVKATEALKLSMRMTDGYKGELFVASLSFLGWGLLNILTIGILGIFFVGPYMQATFAGYYLELKENALNRGVITIEELI